MPGVAAKGVDGWKVKGGNVCAGWFESLSFNDVLR
jgi:hypothetical protein